MPEWSAEIAVDEPLVRRLLGSQFPELEPSSLRPLAEGWDNSVWVVDERLAFRFPRRAIAVDGVRREIVLLPQLAPLLPLAIPVPLYVGRPDDAYPWPFFGALLLRGREIPDAEPDAGARKVAGATLAAFLQRLHGPEAAALAGPLPVDPVRRADMAFRVPRTVERLAEVERLGLWRAPATVQALLDDALALPEPEPTALVHGDLHFRHVLLADGGAVTGVIDWGDASRNDPAVDLVLYWSFLPPGARPAFLEAYGPVDEAALLRARVLALFLCAALALYGRHEGLAGVEREALAGLDRAASG